MPLGDIGGILRGLMGQVSLVDLTPEEEKRVRELVGELQRILDTAAKRARR